MTFIKTDILNPYNREIISTDDYDTLIDFLQDKYPDGFDNPVDVSINGTEIKVDDYDTVLQEHDIIVLLDRTALPVGLIGGWFITALANLAISVTLSYVANKLFAPDAPDAGGQTSSVYTINSAQNAARYGSPIPIVYGMVRMYPSMIVQPYYRYENNVEYLYHVLCVGQGTMNSNEVLIGDDEITTEGVFDWKLLYQDSFYNIPLHAYGFHITKTLSVPSNVRLDAPVGTTGTETEKYKISAEASHVEFDYIFPNGIFWIDAGEYKAENTNFRFRVYTLSGGVYTQVYTRDFYDNTLSRNAIQRTFSYDLSAYDDPVYVSFQRTVDWGTVDMYIKRLKEIHPNEDFTSRYGDITLLVCKIKATNTVSARGQVKINGWFERTDVGNTMSEVLTDLYTNTKYGGGLDPSDLSFPVTTERVNCAYDSSMTIFDAMRKPALAQGYSLYLAGMDVILKKDGVNNITSGMYNEMNILKNSLKMQYVFKEEYPAYDGFECTYMDGCGWIPRSVKYPPTSIKPKKVDLFGVVDYTVCDHSGTVYPTMSMTITSTLQPTISYPGGTVTYDDNGDGTWHVWSQDEITVGSGVTFTVTTGVTKIVINKLHTYSVAGMFYNLQDLTELDMSGFDTRDVSGDAGIMFQDCASLLSVDMSVFSNMTGKFTSMSGMFYRCSNLVSINFTGVDMTSVTNMNTMFYNCFDLSCMSHLDTRASYNNTVNTFNGCSSLIQPNASVQALLTTSPGLYWKNLYECG